MVVDEEWLKSLPVSEGVVDGLGANLAWPQELPPTPSPQQEPAGTAANLDWEEIQPGSPRAAGSGGAGSSSMTAGSTAPGGGDGGGAPQPSQGGWQAEELAQDGFGGGLMICKHLLFSHQQVGSGKGVGGRAVWRAGGSPSRTLSGVGCRVGRRRLAGCPLPCLALPCLDLI